MWYNIEDELNFINKDHIYIVIRGFLSIYIHEKIRIQDFHNKIFLPLLDQLEIPR